MRIPRLRLWLCGCALALAVASCGGEDRTPTRLPAITPPGAATLPYTCLLYTSDAADDLLCVTSGGRRILTKNTLSIT